MNMKQLQTILTLTKVLTIELLIMIALALAYLLPPSTRGPVYLFELYIIAVLVATKSELFETNIEYPITKWWALS